MANRNVTLKRNNAGTTEELYPTTDWVQINNKPSTFTPTAHTHSGADITSGTVSTARLGSGAPSSSNFLRGDGTWASVEASGNQFVNITGDTMTGNLAIANNKELTFLMNGVNFGSGLYVDSNNNTLLSARGGAGKTLTLRTYTGSAWNTGLVMDDTGNVGIGTTSPVSKLEVYQSGNGASNSLIVKDDARQILIGRDEIKGQLLNGDSSTLYINHTGGNIILNGTSGNVGIGTTSPGQKLDVNGNIKVSGDNRHMTFGTPGAGTTVGARFFSIEGNTDTSGEGSGRIFFTEHNSTTASMDSFGMSLGYRGGDTNIVGASGNTWTGLTQIGNGQWGMWGHNGNANGALIMSGDRAATYVRFQSRVELTSNAYIEYNATNDSIDFFFN